MNNTPALPNYIAICGNPKSGKSLVQALLKENYAVTPVDDGFVLRDLAMRHLGAKEFDVCIQEGKALPAFWPNGEPIIDVRTGEHMTWRRVLGIAGEQLEALLGPYAMPMMACSTLDLSKGPYSFGSVRKTQGRYFKERGGLIIGIRNPMAPPTGNAFDVFDESLVDLWIENDALYRGLSHFDALKDLSKKVHQLVADYSWAKAAA